MPAKWFRKNGEAEAEDALTRRDGRGRALTRRREGYKKHSRVEAEEAAVDSQEVAAQWDAVPDAGLQEVQAGVGIYRGSAFLEDGHYAAEDVGSGTMFAADGAVTLHNSLVTIQLDNAMENVSPGDTEKYDVSYG